MSNLSSVYRYWLDFDGRKVVIDGMNCVLRCDSYMACYPYEREVVRVDARPNKQSRAYRDTKREMGDDWSIDVLASDCELQADILQQLGVQKIR